MDNTKRCDGWYVDTAGRCTACGRTGVANLQSKRSRTRAHVRLDLLEKEEI